MLHRNTFAEFAAPRNIGDVAPGHVCGICGLVRHLERFTAARLRGLGTPRHKSDAAYGCQSRNGTPMRRPQRHNTMPFAQWRSYVASFRGSMKMANLNSLVDELPLSLTPHLIIRGHRIRMPLPNWHLNAALQMSQNDAFAGLASIRGVHTATWACHCGVGIRMCSPQHRDAMPSPDWHPNVASANAAT